MKNYVSKGHHLTFTSGADIASGAAVVLGSFFGVATGDIKAGEEGTIALVGVYSLPKAPSEAWAVGDKVYWDATNWYATISDGVGANALIGAAWEAVGGGASDTIGKVRLNGIV